MGWVWAEKGTRLVGGFGTGMWGVTQLVAVAGEGVGIDARSTSAKWYFLAQFKACKRRKI